MKHEFQFTGIPVRQQPIVLYVEMKKAMPMAELLSTSKKLDPTLSDKEITDRADALAQWMATIPVAWMEQESFQMIETVDVVWHAFILHTRQYREFCHKFYGAFLDHDPPLSYEEDRRSYADYTLKKLQTAFGDQINPLLLDLEGQVKCCFRYNLEK